MSPADSQLNDHDVIIHRIHFKYLAVNLWERVSHSAGDQSDSFSSKFQVSWNIKEIAILGEAVRERRKVK